MRKSKFNTCLKSLVLILCAVIFPYFFAGCSLVSEKETTYAISGQICDDVDGSPVVGAVVSSDKGDVVTDENGMYTISNITGSIVIKPSADGYYFEEVSKLISSENDNANFVASKVYTIIGSTKSNDVAVPNVSVTVESIAGVSTTISDENGDFIVSGVAGEAKISCYDANGTEFFNVSTTIESPNVEINTTTSFTLNFEFDDDVDFGDDLQVTVDGEKWTILKSSATLYNVYCGSVVEISSNKFNLSKQRIVVDTIDQVETIVAQKYYSISGQILSGTTPLGGASIYIGNHFVTIADGEGKFSKSGLYGENIVSVSYEDFVFESQTASLTLTELEFVGTKSIQVKFSFDYESEIDILVEGNEVAGSSLYLSGVELGESLSLQSQNFHLSDEEIVVSEQDIYTISCYALFNASVNFSDSLDGEGVIYLLDGNETQISELSGLYGSHEISAKYSNYVFDSATVNFDNKDVTLSFVIPYDVEISVFSGDIEVCDFDVFVNGEFCSSSNETNVINLKNLIAGDVVSFECENYDIPQIVIQNGESITLTATYSVSVNLLCGSSLVSNVTVYVGENEYEVQDGVLTVTGLVGGGTEVSAEKEDYTFESSTVSYSSEISLNSTYKIYGKATDKDGKALDGYVVALFDTETNQISSKTTDENGSFEFSGLCGEYWLYVYEDQIGDLTELKPEHYEVSAGGEYNFSMGGFSVSGTVLSGGVPVQNAKVVAGTSITYTDSNGKYSFEVLTSTEEIVVSKKGYSFSVCGESAIASEENSVDGNCEINFDATYLVSGVVSSSSFAIQGVLVYDSENLVATTDENGYFEISALAGNVELKFVKEDCKFDNETILVSGYATNLSVDCSVKKTISVYSGETEVDGFNVYVNGELYTNSGEENSVSIYLNYGDEITFSKDGYVISAVIITDAESYETAATYSISGYAVSGTKTISYASISIGENVYTANSQGYFEIQGLSGETSAIISKSNYNTTSVTFFEYETEIQVNLTYDIGGYVYVGSKGLEGTLVQVLIASSGEVLETTTDTDGYFEIKNISGYFSITCEKETYTFDTTLFSGLVGSQNIVISAMYTISGVVKSGDLLVSDAIVTISQEGQSDITANTNSLGQFSVSGVTGEVSVSVSKTDYSLDSASGISDSCSLEFDLSYQVSLTFDVIGVTIFVNEEENQVTQASYVQLSGLRGENVISFEKANNSFSPSSLTVSAPQSSTISNTMAFDISGTVTTSSGIAVSGVTLVASSVFAVTDENGYYEMENVIGSITFENSNFSSYQANVTESTYNTNNGVFNFKTISNTDFAYYLYETGYANLDSAASYQIFGSGTAEVSLASDQTVRIVSKKDNNGNVIKQNLNYGKVTLGIDPSVSLLTYYDCSSGSWSYSQTSNVDSSSLSATYSSWSGKNVSEGGYAGVYGVSPSSYLPYTFSKSSGISSISDISLNSDGNYVFKITLNATSSVYSNYATQINALSGQTVSSFSYIYLNYEIDKNGWIVNLEIDEKYIVTTFNVTISQDVVYTFYTQSANLKIDDVTLDVDNFSNSAIQSALQLSEQSEITLYSSGAVDVVSALIYGK